jgi:ABC-2 type transport system ATP-binding protein
MSSPALPLAVRALSKAYRGRTILHRVSFEVEPGEAVAVLGPNGAGKSTLLGCITGDRLPDSGDVRVCGIDPFSDLPASARCTGVVGEHPFLYGELTVAEMLELVQELRRSYVPDAAAESDRLLALLGLQGAEGTLCRELSQGMGRKVAIIASPRSSPNGVARGQPCC